MIDWEYQNHVFVKWLIENTKTKPLDYWCFSATEETRVGDHSPHPDQWAPPTAHQERLVCHVPLPGGKSHRMTTAQLPLTPQLLQIPFGIENNWC